MSVVAQIPKPPPDPPPEPFKPNGGEETPHRPPSDRPPQPPYDLPPEPPPPPI